MVSLSEQLEQNMNIVPSTFLPEPNNNPDRERKTINLDQLSWFNLGQLLFENNNKKQITQDTKKTKKQNKDETDDNNDENDDNKDKKKIKEPELIIEPEPIIDIKLSPQASKDLDKIMQDQPPKKKHKSKLSDPQRSSGRIGRRHSFLDFINEYFNENAEPFETKEKKRKKSLSAMKLDTVSSIEVKEVHLFLQSYGNVASNGEVVEYGNTGFHHFLRLYLSTVTEKLDNQISDPNFLKLLTQLDEIRRKTYPFVQTVNIFFFFFYFCFFFFFFFLFPQKNIRKIIIKFVWVNFIPLIHFFLKFNIFHFINFCKEE